MLAGREREREKGRNVQQRPHITAIGKKERLALSVSLLFNSSDPLLFATSKAMFQKLSFLPSEFHLQLLIFFNLSAWKENGNTY